MGELRSIVSQEIHEYGRVKVKLAEVMEKRKITRNGLRVLINVKYDVITRYYKGVDIEMVDLNFLAKVCFALNCKIEDLLEYEMPRK